MKFCTNCDLYIASIFETCPECQTDNDLITVKNNGQLSKYCRICGIELELQEEEDYGNLCLECLENL